MTKIYQTGTVVAMAIAAENTAIPTLVDKGKSITYSGDWTAITFKIHEDDFNVVPVDPETVYVKPPTAANKVEAVHFGEGVDRIEFTAYEIGEDIYTLATNATVAIQKSTFGLVFTRTALVIEFLGTGIIYMPSVEIRALPPTGGVKKVASQKIMVDVFGTVAVPAGAEWHHFEDPS